MLLNKVNLLLLIISLQVIAYSTSPSDRLRRFIDGLYDQSEMSQEIVEDFLKTYQCAHPCEYFNHE